MFIAAFVLHSPWENVIWPSSLCCCLKIKASKWCASLRASVSNAVVLCWKVVSGQPPRNCRRAMSGVQCVRWHSRLADRQAARGAQEALRAAARGRGGGGWESADTSKCVFVCTQLSWTVWLYNRCIIIRERPSGGRSLFGSVRLLDGDESSSCHWLDAAIHTPSLCPSLPRWCGFYSRHFLCVFQHRSLRVYRTFFKPHWLYHNICFNEQEIFPIPKVV